MGAVGSGPVLVHVPVDEVDGTGGPSAARTPSAAQRVVRVAGAWAGWRSRRPWLAVVALVAVVVVLTGAVVATPRLVTAHERATVLGPAAFDGAIRPATAPPQVRWSAPVDVTVPPLLAGGSVVVATGTGADDRALTGLDVVTGAVAWSVPLGVEPVPHEVRCVPVGVLVACALAPGPGRVLARSGSRPEPAQDAALLLLDPGSGAVLRRAATPGQVVSLATAPELGEDVVLASVASERLTIRRLDPRTGQVRWRADRPSSFPAAATSRVRLALGGGLVVASAEGSTVVVRAADGSRVPAPADASGTDETFLRPDGTLVRTRYRLEHVGVDVRSDLSTGEGAPWLTVRGVPVEPAVSDGSSGLVFASSSLAGGPLTGRVRAYAPGRSNPLWHALTPAREIAADVDGRVVLRAAGALVGLDAATGEAVWRRTFGLGMGSVFSDGRLVVVQRTTPDEGAVLLALDLQDGRTRWVADLPAESRAVHRLGAHLYVTTDDTLVALR